MKKDEYKNINTFTKALIKNLKTMLVWTVVIFALIILSSFFVKAYSGSGSGTSESPYIITNCSQLNEVDTYYTSYFILGNNIDCDDITIYDIGDNYDNRFSGNFNGNGKIISNLNVESAGLFSEITSGARIHDLGLFNVKINNTNPVDYYYTGGVVGRIENAKIYNISAKNMTIYCSDNRCGGLIGGGGYYNNIVIENSYFIGKLILPIGNSGYQVGGIFGLISEGKIINTYSSVTFENIVCIGNKYGVGDSSEINNSYFNNETETFTTDISRGRSENDLKIIETFTDWDFVNVWQLENLINNGMPSLYFEEAPVTTPPTTFNISVQNNYYYEENLTINRNSDATLTDASLIGYKYYLYKENTLIQNLTNYTNETTITIQLENIEPSDKYYIISQVTDSNQKTNTSISNNFSVSSRYNGDCNETITVNSSGVTINFNWTYDDEEGNTYIYLSKGMVNHNLTDERGEYNITNQYYGLFDVKIYQYELKNTTCQLNFCKNNYEKIALPCIDNLRYINYTDVNNCEEQYDYPTDIGTYEDCQLPPNTDKELWLIIILIILWVASIILSIIYIPLIILATFIIGVFIALSSINYFGDATLGIITMIISVFVLVIVIMNNKNK